LSRCFHFFVLATASLPALAAAQARDTARSPAVYRIPELRVQATRPVTTVGGSSAIEVRMDSMVLQPAPMLETVLRELPMLHVRTNSRGESEISARGSESRQVAVLIDGVPLTLAWDARTDVSVIPASAPQEIGYIRGLSSMLYGPNVLGGVVEIGVGKSFLQPAENVLQATAGIDHVGGFGGSATIGLPGQSPAGEWLLRAGAAYRESPGQPLPDDVVEPVPTDDDLRLNTDAENVNGFLTFRYRRNTGAWFSFSGSTFSAERGIAAELGVDNARFWRYPEIKRTIAVLTGGTGDRSSPLGGHGDVEFSVGVDVGRTDIDAYSSRQYNSITGFEDGEDRTLTLRLLADQDVGSRGDLRAAATWAEVRHDEFLPNTADARYRQRLISLGAETNWRVLENAGKIDVLRFSLGGAFDAAETPESGGREPRQERLTEWGGRLGVTAAINGGRSLLHAGVSRRGRFASLRELYSGALNRFQPNPNLKPEKLIALEAGVTMRLGEGEVQLVGFHHNLEDAVVRITLPDRRFLRVNRNELNSSGVELLLTQSIKSLRLTGDVTFQSVDLTTEPGVTNRPENLPEIFGKVNARFPIVLGFEGAAGVDYMGDQFCIDPGTGEDTELDAGAHLNLELARTFNFRPRTASWFTRVEGRVSADNVADVARYDQCGLPQPGRLLRFQIRLF
jgi:iron complex outermembrane receptor protein